jgi:putative transposase
VAQWRAQQAEPPRTEIQVMADQRRIREFELTCRVLDVPRSSYYAFAGRPARAGVSPVLLKVMRQIHMESRRSYGSRRMSQALQQQGHAIGRHRARSLMREAQLAVARRRTHRYRKAEGDALVAPNLLERRFEPGASSVRRCPLLFQRYLGLD